MIANRSLRIALVTAGGLVASATTFAWAGAVVGGHRADHIGTFQVVVSPTGSAPVLSNGRPATSSPSERTFATSAPSTALRSTPVESDPARHDDD